jgi:multicomponent Na+:H+ antiporter subunit G
MNSVLELIAILAVFVGTFFSVMGVLGFIRLPDVYTRLHTTGKVSIFGVVLLLIAAVFWKPLGWGRGLILIVILMISGPATAHALGSAANRIGLPRVGADRDDLLG